MINYIIPIRKDSIKVDISIADFPRYCCTGKDSCWFYIGSSVLIINEIVKQEDKELECVFVYDGFKGFTLHIRGKEESCIS